MSGITFDHINKRISFNTKAPSILGSSIKNAKLLSILHYSTALKYRDIAQAHANIFPYLPQGTPNDFRSYNYIQLELLSGEVVVLGLPWIDLNSVVVNEEITFVVTIPNKSSSDLTRIRNALISNGIDDFKVELLEP